MNTSLPLVKLLEAELAQTMISLVENNTWDEDRTSKVAQKILILITDSSTDEELNVVLPEISKLDSVFSPITYKYQHLINERKTTEQVAAVKDRIDSILYGSIGKQSSQ